MSIEKRGVIADGFTPLEDAPEATRAEVVKHGWAENARSRSDARRKAELTGLDPRHIDRLDEHMTKRAADKAAAALGGDGS